MRDHHSKQEVSFCPVRQANTCLFVAVVFSLLALSACQPSAESKTAARLQPVRVAHARIGPMREKLRYVGTVHSANEVKVLARISGRLTDLPAKEGEKIKKGRRIAVISSPEIGARTDRARAELARADYESAFLCQTFVKDKRLFNTNAISKLHLDDSRRRCESSQAAKNAAQAGLNETSELAAKTSERAPFDGVVLQWLADPGQNVLPGQPVLLLGDNALEVRVMVQEKDIYRGIRPGLKVALRTFDRETTDSAVSFVAPGTAGPARTVEVRIPIEGGWAASLRHGASMDVDFILAENEDAVSVPVNALAPAKDGETLFLVQDDRLLRHKVKTGIRQDGWAVVETALPDDPVVVVGNLDPLKDGMRVYPVRVPEVQR